MMNRKTAGVLTRWILLGVLLYGVFYAGEAMGKRRMLVRIKNSIVEWFAPQEDPDPFAPNHVDPFAAMTRPSTRADDNPFDDNPFEVGSVGAGSDPFSGSVPPEGDGTQPATANPFDSD